MIAERRRPCRLLYRRAVRIRRLTGDPRFKSLGEIEGENFTMGEMAKMTLVRPFVLGFTEPVVACLNLYIALVYGTSPTALSCLVLSYVLTRSFTDICQVFCTFSSPRSVLSSYRSITSILLKMDSPSS